MNRFRDFVAAIEGVTRASVTLRGRIDGLADRRPPVPLVRAAVEHAAGEVAERIAREKPFEQPRDMLDDEWNQAEIVLLRSAIDTLEGCAVQRAADFDDWLRDLTLALDEFEETLERFRASVEF